MFLGNSIVSTKSLSEETANLIDSEVKDIISEGYDRAKTILTEYHNELEILAQALLEHETLSGDEINDVLAGKKIDRSDDNTPSAPKQSSVPHAGNAANAKDDKEEDTSPPPLGEGEPA